MSGGICQEGRVSCRRIKWPSSGLVPCYLNPWGQGKPSSGVLNETQGQDSLSSPRYGISQPWKIFRRVWEELSRFPLALTFQIENTSFTLGLAPPHVFYHFPLCFPEMKIPSPHPRTSEIPFIVHCLQCLIVNNVTSPHYLLVLLKNRHRADPRPTSFLLAYQEVLSLQTKLMTWRGLPLTIFWSSL